MERGAGRPARHHNRLWSQRPVDDYVRVDPDEPAVDGSFVAVRDPGRGGETVVRLLIERGGRRVLRTLDGRCSEHPVETGNETDTQSVVVLVGNTVRVPPPAPRFAHRRRGLPASTASPPRPPCGEPPPSDSRAIRRRHRTTMTPAGRARPKTNNYRRNRGIQLSSSCLSAWSSSAERSPVRTVSVRP